MIFVGLTAILIYNNITQHGTAITTWLLSALALDGALFILDPYAENHF
ncbi:membrane protein [Klebsiella pneumoniae subsp. rhinoscleromatis]|nr:membrane protein [Klebsiella pneumoniae subsp. rhinoscleromatis]